jgi:hypothetical protein
VPSAAPQILFCGTLQNRIAGSIPAFCLRGRSAAHEFLRFAPHVGGEQQAGIRVAHSKLGQHQAAVDDTRLAKPLVSL